MNIYIFQMKILEKILNFAWNKSTCSISKLHAGCMSVNLTTIYNLALSFVCGAQHGKGVVIFNSGYQGGRKLPKVWELRQLRSWGMNLIGRPRPGYENVFNNSFKRPLGAKTAGLFFKGYKTCQARFEERNFHGTYNYAYILKDFCSQQYIIVVNIF